MLTLLKLLFSLALFAAPGAAAAKLLGRATFGPTALVASTLAVFEAIMLLTVVGAPLGLGTLTVCLVLFTVGLLALGRRLAPATEPATAEPATTPATGLELPKNPIAWSVVGVLSALFVVRVFTQPLSGLDTPFRWDHLALLLLEHGHLDYYPPIREADYAFYYWLDSIPPLVSGSYFWLYAAQGEHSPRLTSLLVVAQWTAILALVSTLASRRRPEAGPWAAACAVCCPLFVWGVGIGQETGLTALALLLIIVSLEAEDPDRESDDLRPCVVAGLGAALAALARPYGWAFWLFALALAWRQGKGRRGLLVLSLVTLSLAGPWYLRTWIRTGNPLYDLSFLGLFPVNAKHRELMSAVAEAQAWNGAQLLKALATLVREAPLQCIALLGLPWVARETRWLYAGALLAAALWFTSVPYTSNPLMRVSFRVAAPGFALLSVPTALLLLKIADQPRWRLAPLTLGVLLLPWAIVTTLAFPITPQQIPLRAWPNYLTIGRQVVTAGAEDVAAVVPDLLPPGTRILSTNSYVHAALRPLGYEIVPPWTPDAQACLDPTLTPAEARRVARKRGITAFLHHPNAHARVIVHESPLLKPPAPLTRLWANPRWILYTLPPIDPDTIRAD